MKLLLIALIAATIFTGTILTIFSPTSWAESQDLSANLIEAENNSVKLAKNNIKV